MEPKPIELILPEVLQNIMNERNQRDREEDKKRENKLKEQRSKDI